MMNSISCITHHLLQRLRSATKALPTIPVSVTITASPAWPFSFMDGTGLMHIDQLPPNTRQDRLLKRRRPLPRQHRLDPDRVVYAQQHPDVIDQGVFHNDVIAVGNQNLLFCHEKAFLHQANVYEDLLKVTDGQLTILEVPKSKVRVETAVQTYLFNSQLLSQPDGRMIIVVPSECQTNQTVANYLQELVDSDSPISSVKTFDLRQSMSNGGGPACLRLRVVLTEKELAAVNQHCLMSNSLFTQLNDWVNRHYRDRLTAEDLADPQLLQESRTALDELTQILDLGSVYSFSTLSGYRDTVTRLLLTVISWSKDNCMLKKSHSSALPFPDQCYCLRSCCIADH